jgi:hypothetical protein
MDHQKSKRVSYQFGIQDFRSFSQSEVQKLNSNRLRFGPETKFSSSVGPLNSVTPKPLCEQSHMSNGKKARRVAQLCGVQLWDRILWEQFRSCFFLTAVHFIHISVLTFRM